MIVVLDNYDSFVHNLARLVRLAGAETLVVRSDAIDADGVAALRPVAVVISPGPGRPEDAGCSIGVVRGLAPTTPILGVCLGHQAIVEAYGGRTTLAPEPMHGRTSTVRHSGGRLFAGVPPSFTACRYHSLSAEAPALPQELRVVATSDDDVVMAVEHTVWPVFGVQFHPEAILTEHGQRLVDNFVAISRPRLP